VRRDTAERGFEVPKSLEDADADAAAAGLVAWKRGSIEELNRHAGEGERSRRRCPGRPGAHHDDTAVRHFSLIFQMTL
jgi:hypothetical protein